MLSMISCLPYRYAYNFKRLWWSFGMRMYVVFSTLLTVSYVFFFAVQFRIVRQKRFVRFGYAEKSGGKKYKFIAVGRFQKFSTADFTAFCDSIILLKHEHNTRIFFGFSIFFFFRFLILALKCVNFTIRAIIISCVS